MPLKLSGRIMDPTVGNRGIKRFLLISGFVGGNEDLTVDQAVSLSRTNRRWTIQLCSNFAMTDLERYG